jgi:hypothetical protein
MTTPDMQAEVSPKSIGKTASSAVGSPPDAKLATSRRRWDTVDQTG